MEPPKFIHKWSRAELSERAASQEHFLDLCKLVGVRSPAELDPTGEVFTFEKGVAVAGPASAGSSGQRGFADVWYKGRFGWEYKRKGKYKSLDDAYRQLCQYREALENPPLLIVSDITRTEIHTNFTGFRSDVFVVELERLHEPEQLALLRRVFTDPESFKPAETAEQVTERAAKNIGAIAQGLRERGHDPHDAAHFLMKVMFCLFAEDVELLPKGLFEKILETSKRDPARLKTQMDRLFSAMRDGGDFGVDEIAYFNGGLFDDAEAIELAEAEIKYLILAADKDWGSVEPVVFGTMFEESLDPNKRAKIGAHYTSRDDIMLVIEPVIERPLRRQWEATKTRVEGLLGEIRAYLDPSYKEGIKKGSERSAIKTRRKRIQAALDEYHDTLASVQVLDPACGSGNFLYVAIQRLLAMEKELILYASRPEIAVGLLPRVRPTQLAGIEINPYAAELAQVVIWIGYLQWMHANGFNAPRNPILENIASIENRDAILAWEDEAGEPIQVWQEGAVCRGQAEWPEADFIVGNPPFLWSGRFRDSGFSEEYVAALHDSTTLPKTSDLCCYWFNIARKSAVHHGSRIGLLATQGIRGEANREVLHKISAECSIFAAWSDRLWKLDGADVQVSIVCFASEHSEDRHLDGLSVGEIFSDLTADIDLTTALDLPQNALLQHEGDKKGAKFELLHSEARRILAQPTVSGESNLLVLRPWLTGKAINGREQFKWIIDFGCSMPVEQAAQFAGPFRTVELRVRPKYEVKRRNWWLHERPRNSMRLAILSSPRFLCTVRHSPNRVFAWRSAPALPDSALVVFARSDDYFFGSLQNSVHMLWARRQGSQVREKQSGDRYVARCFETFPLPWAPCSEPGEGKAVRDLHDAIADTAHALNEQRERWLNPPEWVEEVAAQVDAQDDFADVARVSGEEARRLIRQSAIDAASAKHPELKQRTLTKLYNERPTWLRLAHKALDEAVLAAYASVDPEGDWCAEWAEVFVDTGAGQPLPEGHELTERRAEIEQAMLGALLRMNLERAESP